MKKVGEIGEADHAAFVRSVARVELGIGKAAAEGDCVFAVVPDGVGGGIQRF